MDVASGRQIRTFRIVLPEDNGPAAANATIARRNTGDRLQGFVEILTQVPFRIDCTVRLQGIVFYVQSLIKSFTDKLKAFVRLGFPVTHYDLMV